MRAHLQIMGAAVLSADVSRVRVLSLQTGAVIGGSELMNFSIIQRIDRGKFEVVMLSFWREGPVSGLYRIVEKARKS